MAKRVRCDYEGELFPTGDFESTPQYGLVHARNLPAGTPTHTKSGYVLDGDDWKAPAGEPRRWKSPARIRRD
jgi:hypothetical protein